MAQQPLQLEQAIQLAWQLHQAGQFEQAEGICRRILAAYPNQTDALSLLGLILSNLNRFDEAISSLQRAIALQPSVAVYHSRLGQVLSNWGHHDQAIPAHRQAIALNAQSPDAYSDLGNALKLQGNLDAAMDRYHEALAIAPDFAIGHVNLGLVLLLRGELKEGFEHFAWRWRLPNLRVLNQQFPQPQWNGEALNGRRILVRAEQGFGDAIMFARYIPLIQQRGGRVILAVRPELVRLMKTLAGVEEFVTHGSPLVPFDVQAALLELPRIFGTTLQTIPAHVPYLHADPALAEQWKTLLAQCPGRKIGLAWSGLPMASNNRRRSVPFPSLGPLFDLPNTTCVSLQKGPATQDARNSALSTKLLDWTDELHDFSDTAALIANLDAVVTVDTAVAHLAGAMGKPVFLLLAHVSDWQWLLNRSDSPWYPTMRLFRQPAAGDWKTPLARVIGALQNV